MIHYILQVLLFQLLFLVVYDVFLKKETFFNYNRLYLLVTSVVSFVIPFLKIEAIQQSIPQEFRVQLPAVLIGNASETTTNSLIVLDEIVLSQQSVSWSTITLGIYLLGIVISILFFIVKLRKLYLLKKTAKLEKLRNYTIATVPNSDVAFTFLNTIFLGDQLTEPQRSNILQHELVHVQQRHTLDLLFFEALRILCWFNPMVYIFQHKIQTLHEYAADRLVASKDKAGYYQNLLSEVFSTTKISFINTFYTSSIIKNRIVMLQKSKSKKIVQLKYLLLIPAVCAMLFYTSCSNDTAETLETEANLQTEADTEVMQKINELAEAIMKKGNLTEEEERALKFLATEAKEGDKVYTSVDEYLTDTKETSDVPFAIIEKVPTYPGCFGNNDEMKECMAKQIQAFVGENFDTKIANTVNLSGRQRISVQFKINRNGTVADVRARAAHPALEAEAIRVVSSLPKMIPGQQKGQSVGVIYALPIVFEINE
ncbi:M56 family metallopeptidase [Rasiella sp. SM2506]|uniref:M56 family metallopeptidase n=1 Tax=Rasiella sp. SM2506 TaxID=3423914 RepID=UPI003D78B329